MEYDYDYWMIDSDFDKLVEAELSQATPGDSGLSTSQPQQSLNSNQYGDTTPVVTEHPATYGDTTTNYPRYFSQSSPSGLLSFETAQPNGSSAAGERDNVSSTYPHYNLSNYPPVPNLGLSGTNLAKSLPIASNQPPHHDACFQFQSQQEPHPENPVNDHQSGSHALGAFYVCRWHDGHGLCGRTVYKDRARVADHMSEYHITSPYLAGDLLDCEWEDCHQDYRRDTINRHVCEVHLKMRRPKARTKKARTN